MKAFCIQCKIETNHKVIFKIEKDFDGEEYWAQGIWQIIQCNGCDEISFREVWKNSDDIDPEDGTLLEDVRLYPIRSKNTLSIKPFLNVPNKVRNIYKEIIDSYNYGLYILCAGGLRAIIEGICNDQGIVDGPIEITRKGIKSVKRKKDLQGKISGLFEKSILTRNHAEILHEHRFLGNEALHDLDQPSINELNIAIEIVELTLKNIYELNEIASDLKYQKFKRKKKN